MNLGSISLFGKKNKDSDDHMQTQEIKSLAQHNGSVSSASSQPQDEFINPFSQNQAQQSSYPQQDSSFPSAPPASDFPAPSMPGSGNPTSDSQFGLASDPFASPQSDSSAGFPSTQPSAPVPGFNSNPQSSGSPFSSQAPAPVQDPQFGFQSSGHAPAAPSFPASSNDNSISKDEVQELIDETIEKIIEEKWDKLTADVSKVISWKEKQEQQINLLKQDILEIKNAFEKVETKLTTRLSSYDKDILDVGAEIKALEMVFQKITPTLVNNVNELSKIAKELKGDKAKVETLSMPKSMTRTPEIGNKDEEDGN